MRTRPILRIFVTIKNSLSSTAAREFYIFLFFVVVSAGFWLAKTLQEVYETEMPVPLVLTDVPENVIITRPLPDTLMVKVRDRGTTLIGLHIKVHDNPLRVSFREFATRQSVGSVIVPNISKRLATHLDNPATVLSIRPDTLSFAYNRGVSRRVPVRITTTISTHPQYYLYDITLSPDSITVYAPQRLLDTLHYVDLEPNGCTDLRNDCDIVIPLTHNSMIKYVPDTVDMHVTVDMYTEKTVRVPIIGVGFPANCRLRTFPSTVEATFRVGTKQYNKIKGEDVVIAAPYEELRGLPSGARWHIHASSLPSGASNPRFVPSDVEYLIEQDANDE